MIDLNEFKQLFKDGAGPDQIYKSVLEAGFSDIEGMRVLREVCGLSFPEAKQLILSSSGVEGDLQKHEEKLMPGLNAVLERDQE